MTVHDTYWIKSRWLRNTKEKKKGEETPATLVAGRAISFERHVFGSWPSAGSSVGSKIALPAASAAGVS